MVKGLIRRLFSRSMRGQSKPWAIMEFEQFDDDGMVKLSFDYNPAFIEKIKTLGYHAETDEDSVQLFFMTAGLRPSRLSGDPGDDAVQSSAHPSLSEVRNEIRV